MFQFPYTRLWGFIQGSEFRIFQVLFLKHSRKPGLWLQREIIYYSQRKMQKRSRKCRKVDRNAKSVIILNVKCKKSSKNHRNHEIINYSQRKMQKSRMTRKKIESGTFGALGWVGWVGLGWAGLRFFGHKP